MTGRKVEDVEKRKVGRHKRGMYFIIEYICIGCGECKEWTFLDPADFEKHLLAQNSCCAKCYLDKVVTEDKMNHNLPVIPWPQDREDNLENFDNA